MSWEPSLVRRDGSPLGTPDEVRQAIDRAFPGTDWRLAPGGADLLHEMERYGTTLSDEWRAQILQTPPHWHGLYDTEPVTVEFHLGPGEQVRSVSVTARGDQAEAEGRLRALAGDREWSIKGDSAE